MLNGHIEDAKHQLSVAESWRHGKESAAQYQNTKLIQAYRSLLDYIIWCDKKFTHSKTGNMRHFLTTKASIIHLYPLPRHAASSCVISYCHLVVRQSNYSYKKKSFRDFWLNAHWCDGIFLSQTQSKLVLLFSDHHDTGDNQDMHSYFRQASVNLKEILKNPGVWDPFILSYVEVSTQSQLLDLIKEAYTSNITQWNRIDSSCSNQSAERKSAAILIIDLYFLHFIATSSWNAIHLAVQQIKCSVRLVLVEFQAKFKWNVPALLIV